MQYLFLGLYYILYAYRWMLFAFVILSWFPNMRASRIYYYLAKLVMPYLNKFRRILPPIAGLDFSPIIAFLLIDFSMRGFYNLVISGSF